MNPPLTLFFFTPLINKHTPDLLIQLYFKFPVVALIKLTLVDLSLCCGLTQTFKTNQHILLMIVYLFLLFGSVRFPSPALLSPLCRRSYLLPLPQLERSSSQSSLPVRPVQWWRPERHWSQSLHHSRTSLRNIRVT